MPYDGSITDFAPVAALIALLIMPGCDNQKFTDTELNACAAQAELADYTKNNNGDQQEAMDAMLLDGDYSDISAMSAAYYRRFNLATVYTAYLDEGRKICKAHRRNKEPINMPDLHMSPGHNVVRDMNGSAMIIKDGENPYGNPDGTCPPGRMCWTHENNGCSDGYHASGLPWSVSNPMSGCVKNNGGGQ